MHTKLESLLSKSQTTMEVMTYYLVVHMGQGQWHQRTEVLFARNGSTDIEPGHLKRGQDTYPLQVQWRLEDRKRLMPGTPWPNLETGAGPADLYLPPAPGISDTSLCESRPRPSVLHKICRKTSANMAEGCWSGDQAVGLGRRPLPDGWFCVDHWRRRISGTDMLIQFYVRPYWETSCRSNFPSLSPSHSVLTPGQPLSALTLKSQAAGRVATGAPISKSLVRLDPEKDLRRKRELNRGL